MDYSLLVGIHFREASVAGELIPSGARTPIGSLLSNQITLLSPAGKMYIIHMIVFSYLQVNPMKKQVIVSLEQRLINYFQIPQGNTTQENNTTNTFKLKRETQTWLCCCRWASIRLGTNMPARAERTMRKGDCEFQLVGEPTGEFYEVVMIFGIIDILQDYDISKKLEHAYKSIQYDPSSISAVDPRQYSRRFRDFIFKVFTDDN